MSGRGPRRVACDAPKALTGEDYSKLKEVVAHTSRIFRLDRLLLVERHSSGGRIGDHVSQSFKLLGGFRVVRQGVQLRVQLKGEKQRTYKILSGRGDSDEVVPSGEPRPWRRKRHALAGLVVNHACEIPSRSACLDSPLLSHCFSTSSVALNAHQGPRGT